VQLLSIGRFSRLSGLGVKALRNYDEIGLLPPAAVDEETGYRFYTASQLEVAESIRRLRRFDLPLEDIRRLIASDDPGELREILVVHQRRLAQRAAQLQIARLQLQAFIDGKEHVMGTASESLDVEQHRRLGIDLFNRTWTLMEHASRTPEEADELVHCAHASAYHWMHGGGTTANRARSEWQCSRVYTVVRQADAALLHARRCLELCESAPSEMEEFDLPFAYEALARAYALAGNGAESTAWLARAKEEAEKIVDEDDRALLESDLATIPS
jgi:DNA-binding transcriptional MerR regulator